MSDIRSSIATMLNVNTYAIKRNPSAARKRQCIMIYNLHILLTKKHAHLLWHFDESIQTSLTCLDNIQPM